MYRGFQVLIDEAHQSESGQQSQNGDGCSNGKACVRLRWRHSSILLSLYNRVNVHVFL